MTLIHTCAKCDSHATLIRGDGWYWYVLCDNSKCDGIGPEAYTTETAVVRWNTEQEAQHREKA